MAFHIYVSADIQLEKAYKYVFSWQDPERPRTFPATVLVSGVDKYNHFSCKTSKLWPASTDIFIKDMVALALWTTLTVCVCQMKQYFKLFDLFFCYYYDKLIS